MILDTTFVVDIMNNEKEAVEKINAMLKNGETILITSLTIFELFSGLIRSKKPEEEKRKVDGAISEQLVLDLDEISAKKAGEIHGTLIKEGKCIGLVDCMIAGIALERKDKVLTRNIKDFSRIKGLEIEGY